jgi:hypothetical protein
MDLSEHDRHLYFLEHDQIEGAGSRSKGEPLVGGLCVM